MYTNSIFEERWWLDAVSNGKSYELFIKENDDIIARWGFVFDGHKIYMPPQTQTMGIWFSNFIMDNDRLYRKRKELIIKFIDQLPVYNVKIALDHLNDYFLPFYWRNFDICPRITYRLDNLNNLDEIYSNFGNIVKKNIKSAIKKVSVSESNDIFPLYNLLEKTFKLQKRKYPFTIDFIQNLYNACVVHNAAKVLYAYDANGNLHSGALFVFDENTFYYLLAGTDPIYRSSGANSLIIWKGIQIASTISKTFDFEGSMIEGIENFVRQFGGSPKVYYEIRRVHLYEKILLQFKPYIKRFLGYK